MRRLAATVASNVWSTNLCIALLTAAESSVVPSPVAPKSVAKASSSSLL